MKCVLVQLLVAAITVACANADTIQLEPSQGILIPAPVAQAMRFARSAYGGGGASSYAAPASAPSSYGGGSASSYSAPAPAAGAYKPASIPAPPCPKNYLFSCQPALSPVPCSAPSSYGGGSSYSAPASAPAPAYGGGSSYSAPAPAPAPSSSYSAPQGAYSQYIPQYAVPFPVVKELY